MGIYNSSRCGLLGLSSARHDTRWVLLLQALRSHVSLSWRLPCSCHVSGCFLTPPAAKRNISFGSFHVGRLLPAQKQARRRRVLATVVGTSVPLTSRTSAGQRARLCPRPIASCLWSPARRRGEACACGWRTCCTATVHRTRHSRTPASSPCSCATLSASIG